MLDRIVFHIGNPRTGTTAIQESLAAAQASLLERGVLHPPARRANPGHPLLAPEPSGEPVEATSAHLELLDDARASDASTLVLASEFFTWWRSPRPLAWGLAICEDLQPRQVDVMAYVRPQWDYIESLYAQLVKLGWIWMPFAEYLEDSLASEWPFDYLKVFGPWRKAFGEQLQVRPYARELLVGGDVVDDFWHTARLGSPPESRRRGVNHRPDVMTTEMLRALREILADHHLDWLLDAETTLRRAQRRIEAELPDDRGFSRLTPELVARVAERFSASNEEFVRDYLGGDGSLFSPPTRLEVGASPWSLSEASERELRVFAEVVERALGKVREEVTSASPERVPPRADTPAGASPRGPADWAAGRRRGLSRSLNRLRRRVRLRGWRA